MKRYYDYTGAASVARPLTDVWGLFPAPQVPLNLPHVLYAMDSFIHSNPLTVQASSEYYSSHIIKTAGHVTQIMCHPLSMSQAACQGKLLLCPADEEVEVVTVT